MYIFLDFAKTFGTVNHEILLRKLHNGMRGIALEWFQSYLTNRHQAVKTWATFVRISNNYLWRPSGKGTWSSPISNLHI